MAVTGGPTVLVGLPAGDRHQLALLTFATCLRRRGVNVVYLGSDIPVEEWVRAADGRRARAAVIGVTSERSVEPAQAVVNQLAAVSPPLSVWVGGSHRTSVSGVHQLPDAVAEAASILHISLAAGRIWTWIVPRTTRRRHPATGWRPFVVDAAGGSRPNSLPEVASSRRDLTVERNLAATAPSMRRWS